MLNNRSNTCTAPPYGDMGDVVNLSEASMRSYKRFAESETKDVRSLGDLLRGLMDGDHQIAPAAPGPSSVVESPKPLEPVISRKEATKAAIHRLLDETTARGLHMQTLWMLEQRVDQWEVFGGLPRPVSADVNPGTLVPAFDPAAMKTSPGALIEDLAESLFKLLLTSSDRTAVIRELKAEKLEKICA